MNRAFSQGPLYCEVCETARATCVIMHTFTCTKCGFKVLLAHSKETSVMIASASSNTMDELERKKIEG